jgi:DNA-directed RNA polymerase specialized sigma24 family protein
LVAADYGQTSETALVASSSAQPRRFLLSRVRNSADVPDLVQEVFPRTLRIPDHDARLIASEHISCSTT